MRRKLNTLAGALLGALLVLTIPLVIAAEGDTNLTNLVLSGDLTVGDDATIAGDLAITGTLTGGGGNIGSEASPIPAIFATDLDVDDDLTVDDDALISGDLTVTGTTALNGHATLANTKDLLVATDGGSDIGASGAEIGTAWIQKIDDGDGSQDFGAHLVPDAAATLTLGTTAAPMLAVYSNLVFTAPPTLISASTGITNFINIVTGASAAVTVTLHDAANADGLVTCVVLSDTTTNDVTVKSSGGTVGKTDRSAAGAAAGTGIVFTDSDDDKYACWVSDGTNWVLAMANATVD